MKVYIKSSCVTCKRTITEMERLKLDIEKRDIFKEPLSESEIKKIIHLAKITPRDLLRKKDKMYKKLGLDEPKFTDSQLILYMSENPGLIRRPIIFGRGGVKIGAKELGSS